jgi:hypothetical protein
MAKELPYFKYFPAEWMKGDITLCSMSAQGLFINICTFYWMKDCNMSLTSVQQRFAQCSTELKELFDCDVLKVDESDNIIIEFLDEQMNEFDEIREKRSRAGKKSGESRRLNTGSTSVQQKLNYKDKDEDKIKEDKDKGFETFWESYHSITNKPKTDKAAAQKKWIKLTLQEKILAVENIQKYFNSLSDKKYCKKARTYLEDKNFNDEFKQNESTQSRYKPL